MNTDHNILFTRSLSDNQVQSCRFIGIIPIVVPFIRIEFIDFPKQYFLKNCLVNDNYVITSQNSITQLFKYKEAIPQLQKIKYYTFSQSLFQQMKKNGFKVQYINCSNASDLFLELIPSLPENSLHYFCSNLSAHILDKDNQNKINFIPLYMTVPQKRSIQNLYSGTVFMSPSAVKAYFDSGNILSLDSFIFSIGKSTSNEIQKHTQHPIIQAKNQTFKGVLELIYETFN
jgi:uroporphyrinogen-III synthase